MEEDCCPKCGECENIHTNYDWSKPDRPISEAHKLSYRFESCPDYAKNTEWSFLALGWVLKI
jgi:hypothetical protein